MVRKQLIDNFAPFNKPSLWKNKKTGSLIQSFGQAHHRQGNFEQTYVIHRNSPHGQLKLTLAKEFYSKWERSET